MSDITLTSRGTCVMHDFYGEHCGKRVVRGGNYCKTCQRDHDERRERMLARDRAIATAAYDSLHTQTINDV